MEGVPTSQTDFPLPSNGTAPNITQSPSSVEHIEQSGWETPSRGLSRRNLLRIGTVLVTGTIVGGATVKHTLENQPPAASKTKLAPVNLTQVAKETRINMTMECTATCVTLDQTTFQKLQTLRIPSWVPPAFVPPPKVIKDIPNTELLIAAIIAGSAVEMTRTSLLYPLLTLKTRIQADINTRQRRSQNRRHVSVKRRLKILGLNAQRHFQEGKLYAGIVPSLLVSVPATGVYYGVRDVMKRTLVALPVSDIGISIGAAFCADVVSLMIRTPADTLAIRLQAATGEESHNKTETEEEAEAKIEAKVGSWFIESIERLPAVILTDLPYLLSRITIFNLFIHGEVNLGYYESLTIAISLLCAFLTTPFDVARTRILIDSDDDPSNDIDGGSGEGLIKTFRTIYKEGDGGIENLFAGWLERTAYLGIGRAWIEPLMILGFIAIRDAILLEWFD